MITIQPLEQRKKSIQNYSYDDNLKVYIRIRPPLLREKDLTLPFRSIATVSEDKSTISLIEYLGFEFDEASKQKELINFPNHFLPHNYTFDHIFDMNSSQKEVYEIAAMPAVNSLLEGYNSTIFAYGQTGTGKTYTMEGFIYDYLSPKKGLIPRAIENIFKYIENNLNSDTTFIIRVTYLQIYNESIDDLLKPEKKNLSIRENNKKGLYVENLSEWAVRSPNDIYCLLEKGAQSRKKSHTNLNDVSSRSHAVFSIILEQMKINNGKKKFKTGKLHMVDLAGSERIKISGAKGKQLEESRRINKSLSALGNVINALTNNKLKHIPYRDSKLTRLLQNSLGGNCKTSMIAMISPYDGSYNESISTLNFAKRAKCIRIKASINEEMNQNALISQYEKEINKLREELNEKNKIINNNTFLKKIEMEKLQAEKDKNEALQALEKASLRFLQEREEKRKLEKKIEIMNFQMIPGGKKIKIEDTPEFKTLLQKHQILLEKDFNEKLNDLEKEKELIAISKEQVDSYNSLLQKQKDIMENMEKSLKEKEENINHLNEMIDSYEKIINEQDNIIEIKNKRIKLLENILIKNKIKFPKEKSNKEKSAKNSLCFSVNKNGIVPKNIDKIDFKKIKRSPEKSLSNILNHSNGLFSIAKKNNKSNIFNNEDKEKEKIITVDISDSTKAQKTLSNQTNELIINCNSDNKQVNFSNFNNTSYIGINSPSNSTQMEYENTQKEILQDIIKNKINTSTPEKKKKSNIESEEDLGKNFDIFNSSSKKKSLNKNNNENDETQEKNSNKELENNNYFIEKKDRLSFLVENLISVKKNAITKSPKIYSKKVQRDRIIKNNIFLKKNFGELKKNEK